MPKFIGCDAEFNESDVVVFGAPYDSTTSYRPGARFGAAAIRAESYGIETFSPYLNRDLELMSGKFHDAGDLELPFGAPEPALAAIEDFVAHIINEGKKPVMLGGEHLVTLGAVRAFASCAPDFSIIHFDAHADLRQDYLGNPLSHATVIRRCREVIAPDRTIHQYGIRSGTREELADHTAENIFTERFSARTLPEMLEKIDQTSPDHPIYVTVDLDVLDPSEFPGTGTPEAGGMRFEELRAALDSILNGYDVIGMDIVELAPNLDPTGRSTALACKLLRECLLRF